MPKRLLHAIVLGTGKGAESEQALDRLPLLLGECKQRQVYILSNVPLNVTVSSIKSRWRCLGLVRG